MRYHRGLKVNCSGTCCEGVFSVFLACCNLLQTVSKGGHPLRGCRPKGSDDRAGATAAGDGDCRRRGHKHPFWGNSRPGGGMSPANLPGLAESKRRARAIRADRTGRHRASCGYANRWTTINTCTSVACGCCPSTVPSFSIVPSYCWKLSKIPSPLPAATADAAKPSVGSPLSCARRRQGRGKHSFRRSLGRVGTVRTDPSTDAPA